MIIFTTIKDPCGGVHSAAGGSGYSGGNEERDLQPKANKLIFTSEKEKFCMIYHGHL